MEYQLIKKEKFAFYGMSQRFTTVDGANFRDIPLFWDKVLKDGSFDEMMKITDSEQSLGVCMPMISEEDHAFDYVIGAFTNEAKEGYDYYDVPEAEWAIFDVRGPVNPKLQEAWKYIFSEWFPETGLKHAKLPEFEVYSDDDVESDDCKTEIWIPIER